jgi:hypothetical protein
MRNNHASHHAHAARRNYYAVQRGAYKRYSKQAATAYNHAALNCLLSMLHMSLNVSIYVHWWITIACTTMNRGHLSTLCVHCYVVACALHVLTAACA